MYFQVDDAICIECRSSISIAVPFKVSKSLLKFPKVIMVNVGRVCEDETTIDRSTRKSRKRCNLVESRENRSIGSKGLSAYLDLLY